MEEKVVYPPSDGDGERFYEIDYWLWEYIRHTAILRLFQIWADSHLSKENIYNGLGIGENTNSSVAGMVSTLSQNQAIAKDENGKWIYNRKRPPHKSYSYRYDFTDSAILRCKEIAREQAKKRLNK